MAWTPKNTGNNFTRELIPATLHMARCFGLVDLGTHERSDYKGVSRPPCQMIQIFWEFPEILKVYKPENGEQPATKSKRFNFVYGDNSNLTKTLKPWVGDPKKILITSIVGKPAQIKIVHEPGFKDPSTMYDNVDTVTELMPALAKAMPPQITPSVIFSIEEHGFDSKEWDALGTPTYEWLQKYIKESLEYKEWERERMSSVLPPASRPGSNIDPDDVPFN